MINKTLVIIGGSSEIGNKLINDLKSSFQIICVNHHANTEKIYGVDYLYGDMTKIPDIKSVVEDIFARHKQVDVLINLIGKNIARDLDDINEEIWSEVIDTNLKSVFFLCKYFGNKMLNQEDGLIVNFASTAGIRPLLKSPHYVAAKAGVISLTSFFAGLYAPGIRVNAIAPGYVMTDAHSPEKYENYKNVINRIPLKKMTDKEEITSAVEYLVKAKTVTGQTLVIDGGMTL